MLIQLKRSRPLIIIVAMLFFISCNKELNDQDNPVIPVVPVPELPDLTTKVTSSVSGFITNENNEAVQGASVKVGTMSTITDQYGFFEVRNVEVVKNAAVVTAEKSGYFKGIKTYIAATGKSAFFRIKLMPKTNTGAISGTTGGDVTLTNGMKIALPASAVVNATTNAAYSGSINVAAYWINPTASDLNEIMPGDLRGIDEGSALKRLTTYGMAAVELTGASGELLQIASGKKATLTMPVPSAILSNAPSSIPLWYFDEVNGLWKQEGSATKTGNTYVGEVSHFSFWNCDVPSNYVQFECTVVNGSGQPVPYAQVVISEVGNPNNAGYGYTDSAGYVSGAIPGNAQLLLEIYSNYLCGTTVHSQNFTSAGSNISLGNIAVNIAQMTADISGTVTDCNSNPVTNGYIIMVKNNQFHRYHINSNGTYSFSTLLCNTMSGDVTFIAEDNIGGQQSSGFNYTLVPGANAIGNLQACGVTAAQFVNYTINGTPYAFTSPTDSFFHYMNPQTSPPSIQISGENYSAGSMTYGSLAFAAGSIASGSIQNLLSFNASQVQDTLQITTPIDVTITEYGSIGEYVAGNFTGVFTGNPPANTTYNISCNFRVRRVN